MIDFNPKLIEFVSQRTLHDENQSVVSEDNQKVNFKSTLLTDSKTLR